MKHPVASDYVSIDDGADYVRTTPRTVRRWIAEGRLPVHRFSQKIVRIRLSDLEALGNIDREREIRRIIDAYPPLAPEQRDRLALLLRPGQDTGS